MDKAVIERVAREFAAIDCSDQNSRIAELEGKIRAAHEAVTRADQRVNEINVEIDAQKVRGGPSGRDVANALVAGVDVIEAVRAGPDIGELERERTVLRASIRDLNRDVEDRRAAIDSVRGEALAMANKAAQPARDALIASAREAAELIITCSAAMTAISRATTKLGLEEEYLLRNASDALMGQRNLAPFRQSAPVPREVIDLLRNLVGKGDALRIGVTEEVSFR